MRDIQHAKNLGKTATMIHCILRFHNKAQTVDFSSCAHGKHCSSPVFIAYTVNINIILESLQKRVNLVANN